MPSDSKAALRNAVPAAERRYKAHTEAAEERGYVDEALRIAY